MTARAKEMFKKIVAEGTDDIQLMQYTEEIINDTVEKSLTFFNDKMAEQLETDIKNAEKTQNTAMDLQQREMVREVVDSVIGDVLKQDDSGINKDEFSNIILKKVA